jgi:mRNA-degrading endonuclease toxin of MazEF toxin-antitoxin module
MRSTTTSRRQRGQVVVLSVPFTDGTGAKLRPAVVVSPEKFHRKLGDLIICPISSQPRYFQKPGPGDRPLGRWSAAGLRHPSTVRVSNILAVEKSLVRRALGKLAAEDLRNLDAALREALGLL